MTTECGHMRTSTQWWAGLQAGDKHIVESVARMQQVIEMSRIVRERHGKPLKTPLRCLTVVAADADFLADLQGELRHYVLEEVHGSAPDPVARCAHQVCAASEAPVKLWDSCCVFLCAPYCVVWPLHSYVPL